jgi:UDP-N-acetylglucosamine 2-epimerase
MKKLHVMTVVGTRPEIIRLSRVMARLDHYTRHVLVHTGQNYDHELSSIFFDQLGLRRPDYDWGRWENRRADGRQADRRGRRGVGEGAARGAAGAGGY